MNRLVRSDLEGASGNNFSTSYRYDANTNLTSVVRYDKDGVRFDSLAYVYARKANGYLDNSNRLRYIRDAVLNSDMPDDIENQDIDNYLYDETGNLVYDDQEGSERLEWDVNNKIRYIKRRSTSIKPDIEFVYDASMKYRVAQIARYKNGTVKTTIYINDAAGNILATYVQENGGEAQLKEQYLYGATRLGTLRSAAAGTLGNREYELTDHLSSVRATVSDLPVSGAADIRNAFDYYPYGMIARSWHSPEKYRFGFNGWERDDDMEKGDGNEYGTEFRQYDSRTGRYSSVDPLAITLAAYSPYSHALGNPVRFVDTEGDWPKPSTALAKVGVSLPPFVAGLMDGLADGSPIGMVGMAWDIASDANFRNEMINAFTEIAKDPVGFIGAMFDDYKDLITRVMEGKATDDDMKRLGEEIGSAIAGAVTGSAMNKIFGKVKAFQKLKLDAGDAKKIASKTDGKSPTIKCASCFTALTKIQTTEGLKEIQDIAVGDSVLSFNELSGKLSYERVESTYQKYRDTIITIHAYGTFIETTTEHPFFVKGEWRRADALKTGMSLTLASGEEAQIEKVEMRLERTAVYNFSVANNHTYTVGNVQFLVHNCGGTGEYSKVGGHHVHAKAGFKNHATYDPKKGFSISQEFMETNGLNHQKMTNKQRELFAELAKSGKPNTLAEHTRIAKEALIAGGASKELADQLVKESLKNLKEQVVEAPSSIPWQKSK